MDRFLAYGNMIERDVQLREPRCVLRLHDSSQTVLIDGCLYEIKPRNRV